MTTPLDVRTEPLGGGPLARLAIAGDARVAPWYERRPADAREWRARAREVRDRFAGSDWRSALGGAFGAAPAGTARLDRVAREGGVVVTTGQQPGLFGGALLVWSKALSALALADALEARTGVPTAPVFWAATDDADFDEASVTTVAVPGGADVLRTRRVGGAGPGTPMSDQPLGDASALLERLKAGTGSAPYARALELLRAAYLAPDATVGGAFVALLRGVLEPLGIAVLDASHGDAREAMHSVARRALERAAPVAVAVAERDAAIRGAGFEPQVENDPELSLVFRMARGVKDRVPVARAAELARSARPGELSGNVLLRPIVERSILPTVAYVAGPAEIAYFAQTSAAADVLELPRPLAVPRWSGTIIEPHVARILERLEIAPADLLLPDAAEGTVARRISGAQGAFPSAALRRAIEQSSQSLLDGAAALPGDVLPRAVVEGALRDIAHRLDRLDRRYLAGIKRRERDTMRDLATGRGALYPGGVRQERAVNFMALLARHGEPLISAMLARAATHAESLVGSANEVDAAALHGAGDAAERR